MGRRPVRSLSPRDCGWLGMAEMLFKRVINSINWSASLQYGPTLRNGFTTLLTPLAGHNRLRTGLQAMQLSPYMSYTDIEVLESFVLRCLPPGMLHSPSSFEVSKPSLAGVSQVCTGSISTPGGLSPHSNYLKSCCLRSALGSPVFTVENSNEML
jgi:hypothetical protein